METGDETRIIWLNEEKREMIEGSKAQKTIKVRMSSYIPEYLKNLVAYEAQKQSHEQQDHVSMSSIVAEALTLYFKQKKQKKEEEDE